MEVLDVAEGLLLELTLPDLVQDLGRALLAERGIYYRLYQLQYKEQELETAAVSPRRH